MMLFRPDWVTFRVVAQIRGMVEGIYLLPRASALSGSVGLGGGKHVLWCG